MKLRIFLCACCAAVASAGFGQQGWLDVTDSYLTNPNFNRGDWDGWTIEHYTSLSGAGGPRCDFGAIELWYCSFRMSQTLNVPNGHYRLSVQGYYRTQGLEDAYQYYEANMEEITSYLFANSEQVELQSIFSESRTDQNGDGSWSSATNTWGGGGWGWGGWDDTPTNYYPASMEAGEYAFNNGMYSGNSVEVDVTDGKLEVGVVNDVFQSNNWCLLDNFKLEYYGSPVLATGLEVSPATAQLFPGETVALKAVITPADVTERSVRWESSDASIVSVNADGVARARREGTAEVTATTADGSNLRASCTVTVIRNDALEGDLVINEIMVDNVDTFLDPSFNYGGWIELYNSTDKAVSLTECYITDDPTDLQKHPLDLAVQSIPAHGFATVWFDHYSKYCTTQIDDELDADGGTVIITDGYNILCSENYPPAIPRTSWARTTDGGDEWGLTSDPTPGASNQTSTFATERLPAPVVNKDGQFFSGTLIAIVDIPEGTTLRYTTDGSTPTLTNGSTSTSGRFAPVHTTVYRFRLFQDGKLPSPVVTRSYVQRDKEYDLPVLSVVSKPDNFYSDEYGVMVKGVNGKSGYGSSERRNWNMDWDRPVNFELLLPETGLSEFNQEANLAICGGWSREYVPHSFKLKGNKVYEGKSKLDYPFFPNKPYIRNKTLQMRTGGNDYRARFKDPALQTIIQTSGLYVDGQSYRPVMSFLNGEYNGIMNMREPNNKHFAYSNYGIDTDELDQFEISPDSQYVQMCGTEDSFLEWRELSERCADDEVYEQICRMLDVDEYCNYWACYLYLGPGDWGRNNVKGFRYAGEGGKWHHVMFDLDSSFGTSFASNLDRTTDGGDYIFEEGGRRGGELPPTIVFRNMLQNAKFRKHFIDAFCLVAGSVFEPTRCSEIIDSLVRNVVDMAAYEGNSSSVTSTANAVRSGLSSSRQTDMVSQMRSHGLMNLYGVPYINARLSTDLPSARILVNGQPVPTNKFGGTLFSPITLKAEAPAGYRFVGWKSTTSSAFQLFGMGSKWSYYDQGSLDDQDWTSPDYKELEWQDGDTPMGFANKDLGYKTEFDSGDKKTTYYFRKKFNLSRTPDAGDTFTLHYNVDDGAVVYVNGTEVGRYRMPASDVTYDTFASSYAGDYDNGSMYISPSLLHEGQNTIAVEVHNVGTYSSDIYWDASLSTTMALDGANIVSPDEEYELPMDSDVELIASFAPLTEEELAATDYCPVKINEVSASNSVFVNEYAKKDDWIELYNTTSEPYDVKGMFLSDNLKKPEKWVIEGGEGINTVIPPHGHLVVWASKREPLTQLHADFKLSADSGTVVLTAADKAWADTLVYLVHSGDESVGLYPDGSSNLYVFSKPTIGSTNLMTTQTLAFEEPVVEVPADPEPEPKPDGIRLISRNGSMSIAYRNDNIHVKCEDAPAVTLRIYTVGGQLVETRVLDTTAGFADVPTGHLTTGHYVARATDSENNSCATKFIQK